MLRKNKQNNIIDINRYIDSINNIPDKIEKRILSEINMRMHKLTSPDYHVISVIKLFVS